MKRFKKPKKDRIPRPAPSTFELVRKTNYLCLAILVRTMYSVYGWPHGIVFRNMLYAKANYADLAAYLLKEADKHREQGDTFKRRYNTSRNIELPEIKREEINRATLDDTPKALKGYYIDGEVDIYEHAWTHLTCREYIMLSTTEEPRIRRWYKGRTMVERENYSDMRKNIADPIQTKLEF